MNSVYVYTYINANQGQESYYDVAMYITDHTYNYSISLVFTWSDNNTVFFVVSLAEDPILMEVFSSIYNLQII